jgi:hypothetical protein
MTMTDIVLTLYAFSYLAPFAIIITLLAGCYAILALIKLYDLIKGQ